MICGSSVKRNGKASCSKSTKNFKVATGKDLTKHMIVKLALMMGHFSNGETWPKYYLPLFGPKSFLYYSPINKV